MVALPSADDLAESDDWLETAVAARVAGYTPNQLAQRSTDGAVERVELQGRAFYKKSEVYALALETAHNDMARESEIRGQLNALVASYIKTRSSSANLGLAMSRRVPLVTAPRGNPRTRGRRGLGPCTVVLDAVWLQQFAQDPQSNDVDFDPTIVGTAMTVFYRNLLEVPGIERVHWVTPAERPVDTEQPTAVRVKHWIRLNPDVFRPRLDVDTAKLLGGDAFDYLATEDES